MLSSLCYFVYRNTFILLDYQGIICSTLSVCVPIVASVICLTPKPIALISHTEGPDSSWNIMGSRLGVFIVSGSSVFPCTMAITFVMGTFDTLPWWRHQMEAFFRVTGPLCGGYKSQWRGALMFPLTCVSINGWINNREAGDLRRYRAHSDVIVMLWIGWKGTRTIAELVLKVFTTPVVVMPLTDNNLLNGSHIEVYSDFCRMVLLINVLTSTGA